MTQVSGPWDPAWKWQSLPSDWALIHSHSGVLLETQHKHLQKTQRTLTSALRIHLTWWQRLRPEVAQPGHLTGVTFLQSERIHESSEVKTHVDNNSPTQTANVQSQQHEVREADSDQLPQKRQAEAGFYFLTVGHTEVPVLFLHHILDGKCCLLST